MYLIVVTLGIVTISIFPLFNDICYSFLSYIVFFYLSYPFCSNTIVDYFSPFLSLVFFLSLSLILSTVFSHFYAPSFGSCGGSVTLLPPLPLFLTRSIFLDILRILSLLVTPTFLNLSGRTLSTCQASTRFVANTFVLYGETNRNRADADVDVFVVVRVDVARREIVVTVVFHLWFR